jgi:hypothetical protein
MIARFDRLADLAYYPLMVMLDSSTNDAARRVQGYDPESPELDPGGESVSQEGITSLLEAFSALYGTPYGTKEAKRYDQAPGETNLFIGPLNEEFNNGTSINLHDRLSTDEDGMLARANFSQTLLPPENLGFQRAYYLQTQYSISRDGGKLAIERQSAIPPLMEDRGFIKPPESIREQQQAKLIEQEKAKNLQATREAFGHLVKQGPVSEAEVAHLVELLNAKSEAFAQDAA